jgi:hypothetical protein
MSRLVLQDCENNFNQLIVIPYGDIIEIEIVNGEPQASICRIQEDDDVQRLYNYLGEWLAARQKDGQS